MNETKYFKLLGRLTELEKRIEALESNEVDGASMLVDTSEQYVSTKNGTRTKSSKKSNIKQVSITLR